MGEEIKIYDSRGKLYWICPFLDKISKLCQSLPSEEQFAISRHCDSIREIARVLQGDECCPAIHAEKIHSPYNFEAVLKLIKTGIKAGNLTESKVDEIVRLYL